MVFSFSQGCLLVLGNEAADENVFAGSVIPLAGRPRSGGKNPPGTQAIFSVGFERCLGGIVAWEQSEQICI